MGGKERRNSEIGKYRPFERKILDSFTRRSNVICIRILVVTHRHQTLVQELTNWSNGTVRLTPKYLEQLYGDDLAVNVARTNGNNPSLIRGRLISRLVADSRDSITPYLLKRSDTSVPVDMVGLIWARFDGECSLHFDVRYHYSDEHCVMY